MTPMYHWLPRRIETHVRLCVLALLIERVAELSLRQALAPNSGSAGSGTGNKI